MTQDPAPAVEEPAPEGALPAATPVADTRLAELDVVRRKLHAAQAILLDALCDPADARALLDEGLRHALAVLSGRTGAAATRSASDLLDALPAGPLPGVPADRAAWVARLRSSMLDSGRQPGETRRALLWSAYATHRVERGLRVQAHRDLPRPRHGFPVRLVAGLLVLAVLGGGGWLLAPRVRALFAEKGWRGEYYKTVDLTGPSDVKRDPELAFVWHEGAPLRGYPEDMFSVRWDTCWRVARPTKARFVLTSDDGSRLFVDGKQIVDNWGGHGVIAKEGTADLEPGSHHLRVEFQEYMVGASVDFKMGFDGAPPEVPEPTDLVFPGLGPVGHQPCADR